MNIKKTVAVVTASLLMICSSTPAVLANDSQTVKEESVYAVTDARGNVKKEIVTDTLKNTKKGAVLSDTSSLKNIQNIKGDEKFVKTGKNLRWKSKGKDITYQGTTDRTLPVEMEISYYLDGNEIEPEDLAGKSGKLSVYVNYRSKTTANAPFMAVSALTLDSSKIKNLRVKNAKTIEEGDSTVVIGYALPGLSSAVNLDGVEIPSHFEFSANVKNFEMDGIMTVVTNDVYRDINLNDVNSIMNLTDSMNKLSSASDQLVEGSDELYDGITMLLNKSGTLTTGVSKLNSGAKELAGGTKQLKTGAAELKKGADALSQNIDSLSTGLKSANEGTKALKEGLKTTGTGISHASKGISSAKENLDSTIAQNEKISNNLNLLAKKMEAEGQTEEAEQLRTMANGLDTTTGYQKQVSAGLSNATEGLNSASYACLNTTDSGDKTLMDAANALDKGTESAYQGSVMLKKEGSDKLSQGTDKLINEGINPLVQGSEDLSEGLETLQNGSDKLISGIEKLQKGSRKLKNGMSEFDTKGIKKLTGYAGNIENMKNRINSSLTLAQRYDNFSGKASNMKGTVKFIYKSEAIKLK